MSVKVYSAAKATIAMKGVSHEQAWNNITSMFQNGSLSSPYIPGHWPLETIRRTSHDKLSVGDIFKYTASAGTPYYVEITDITPLKSLTFEEQARPLVGLEIPLSKEQMNFRLEKHPEATIVSIIRREKRDIGFIDQFKQASLGHAAGMLQYILTNAFWEEGMTTKENMTVVRADNERLEF